MMSYYVTFWLDEEAKKDIVKSKEIDNFAWEYSCVGCGDPKLGLLELESSDPGDYAYIFYEKNHAIGFLKEVVDLEGILSARIGKC